MARRLAPMNADPAPRRPAHAIRRVTAVIGALLVVLAALATPAHAATPAQAATRAPGSLVLSFDHRRTGFVLDGAHRNLPCEACHRDAIFHGTPRACAACHVPGSRYHAIPKTRNHIPSTDDCAACHDTDSFSDPTRVDHAQIPLAGAGHCMICHNGTLASGKGSSHVPTTADCSDCHLTDTWAGGGFDHTGILTGCAACHDGVKAVGLSAAHLPTTQRCENCHTTGIGTRTPQWTPAIFDHTQMAVSTCATCHDGNVRISTGTIPGEPGDHLPPVPATADCSTCHANTPAAETWTVISANLATLHANLPAGGCAQCHGGQTFAGAPAPYVPMSLSGVSPTHPAALSPPHIPVLAGTDCSACHAANYVTGGFGPATAMTAATHAFVSSTCTTCHESGRSFYVGGGTPLQGRPADHTLGPMAAPNDCSQCHTTANWNSDALPAGHMPNPAHLACAVCHTAIRSSVASYATLASVAVLHTGITAGCAQCHGATAPLTFYDNNDNPKSAVLSPAHIPVLAGTDCSACHAPNYVTGGFGPTNMTPATHAFVSSTCTTCHEAGASFYMGTANPPLQGRPADHSSGQMVAPNDCSLCHTTANWTSTALPAGHMPNPANQPCATCHVGAPGNYAALASIAVLHTGITTGCAQCHGAAAPLTFYDNNDNPKSAVLSPPHIPALTGTDCSNCHAPNYVAGGFGPTNMTPATHAFVSSTCTTCHEAGASFYMGAANPPLQGRPADHSSGQMVAPNDCSLCHTTANWNSTALPAGHMPNPANQPCSTCHTAAPSSYTPTTLAAYPVLHTGIASGCMTCHGAPNAAPPVFYDGFTPKSATLSPVHLPTGQTPCEDCHSPTTFTSFSGTTMDSTKHTSMFGFIGSTCDACHESTTPPLSFYGVSNLTVRPSGHNVGQDCSGCHNTSSWDSTSGGNSVNASSRSKVLLVVKPKTTTTAAAARTFPRARDGIIGARRARFTHAGIGGDCASCHDGVLATGKPANHVASGAACSDCHTTLAWLPATFDHRGVLAPCASCHDGVTAQGLPIAHAVTTRSCGACHGTLAWRPVAFDHRGTVAACVTCHNGLGATGKPLRHVVTAEDCDRCHDTLGWSFIHAAPPPPLWTKPPPPLRPPPRPAPRSR